MDGGTGTKRECVGGGKGWQMRESGSCALGLQHWDRFFMGKGFD